jgi:hypothetical protein
MVSHPTIYKVLKKAWLKLFIPLANKNERYNKSYLGEMIMLTPNIYLYLKKKRNKRRENIYSSASMIFHVSFMQAFIQINPKLAQHYFYKMMC